MTPFLPLVCLSSGEGGVYEKPKDGKTKVGSTSDFKERYGKKKSEPNNIEVEVPQTRKGPPEGVDDSEYRWTPKRQRRFDEEYVDRSTPADARYRDPNEPKSPVSQENWDKYRHIFGYGDVPSDYGY